MCGSQIPNLLQHPVGYVVELAATVFIYVSVGTTMLTSISEQSRQHLVYHSLTDFRKACRLISVHSKISYNLYLKQLITQLNSPYFHRGFFSSALSHWRMARWAAA